MELVLVVVLVWGWVGGGGVECSKENVFRTGAVLASTGTAQGMVHARRGYEFAVGYVNEMNEGRGFRVKDVNGKKYYFKFSFDSFDDGSDAGQHEELLKSLVEGERPVDFLFGSHPEFALEETRWANKSKRINIQCCVGPDEIYEQDLPYVFGVQVTSRKYPELTLYSMGLKGIKRIAVIYRKDNPFTYSTCEAAKEYINKFQNVEDEVMEVVLDHAYTKSQSRDKKVFQEFVKKSIDEEVEAVIACSFEDDGKLLVEAYHEAKKSMKAFFMTVGPASDKWVQELGELSEFMLSAGQWHKQLKYEGSADFGRTSEYNRRYEAFHGAGIVPTYVSAGASVSVNVLMVAIQNAFAVCDLSSIGGNASKLLFDDDALVCKGGDEERINGNERVRRELEIVELETFFGRIKFNEFRRNVANDPPTTQVLRRWKFWNREAVGEDAVDLRIAAVLPVTTANRALVMPGKNKYKPICLPGFSVGEKDFDPCEPCDAGKFSNEENADYCERCPAGSYVSEKGQSKCALCPQGTKTDGPGAKSIKECYCEQGFYAVEGKGAVECMECPVGAICNGSAIRPYPKRGYWMNDTMRTVAYECDSESMCIGGPELACEIGYNGRMCSDCSDGYYGVTNFCFKCPPKSVVVIFIVLMVFGWYVINVVVSKNVASLEMILSWAQLANVIGDVDLHWPSKLQVMFGVANVLDFDVDILEPSCLTNWSFMHNTVVQLLLPFLMSLMAFLGYLSSWIAHKCKRYMEPIAVDRLDRWLGWLVTIPHCDDELRRKWDTTTAAFLSSIEVTYITVAKYCFDVFKCEDIGGVSVLRTAPSVECGTHEHRQLKALGILGTLVYSIGYLLFVTWKIWHLHVTRTFHKSNQLRRYGFLYCRFELDYCWTPIVVLGRRLLFVMILVFVNNPGFQAGALAIIINASLMLHVYTAPYVDTYLDVMFSFLLVALMFESFSGVLFYSTNLPSSNRVILEWIVLGVLFALVAISVYFLFAELIRKCRKQFIKEKHCKEIVYRKFFTSLHSSLLMNIVSSEARDAKKMISNELLDTFDTSFLYSAFKNDPKLIADWGRLNEMLKDFMSDQSDCSYLSRHPVAKFWRKLVDRFPELVDFLAVADEDIRGHFISFITTLYRDFYLTNKVKTLPIFGILNWRDRAPMAQWLAMASKSDREFFTSFMSKLFEAVGMDPISAFDEKVANEVAATSLAERELARTKAIRWDQLNVFKRRGTRELAIAELNSGKNPLDIQRRPSMQSSATSVFSSTGCASSGSLSTDKDSNPDNLDCIHEDSKEQSVSSSPKQGA